MNDPGRAVAWSRDGASWQRHDAGREIDLGVFPSADGTIEFWLDNCYRDAVSAGPVYFDYVRLYPTEDPAAANRLFEAARWKPANLTKGSVEERTVEVKLAPSNCVQCGAITAKGGRLTPPEGGSGPEYTLT